MGTGMDVACAADSGRDSEPQQAQPEALQAAAGALPFSSSNKRDIGKRVLAGAHEMREQDA